MTEANGSRDVEAVLATVPMFRHLGPRQRDRLAQLFCRRSYQAGDVVVRQGDTSMSFYLVLSGRVRVVRDVGDVAVDIVEEGAGSFFGEMGVIDDLPRAATVVALGADRVRPAGQVGLSRELSADPGIALALISVLNARIRTLEDRLTRTGGN